MEKWSKNCPNEGDFNIMKILALFCFFQGLDHKQAYDALLHIFG